MVQAFARAVVSKPDAQRLVTSSFGQPVVIHATAAETGGAFGIWESGALPGTGPAMHIHTRETEIFRVLAGTFRFWCGDESFDAPAGTTVTLPPHVPHSWKNIGTEPGRVMGIVTPGGFEAFFEEIARSGATTPAEVGVIETRFGVASAANGGLPPAPWLHS